MPTQRNIFTMLEDLRTNLQLEDELRSAIKTQLDELDAALNPMRPMFGLPKVEGASVEGFPPAAGAKSPRRAAKPEPPPRSGRWTEKGLATLAVNGKYVGLLRKIRWSLPVKEATDLTHLMKTTKAERGMEAAIEVGNSYLSKHLIAR